MIAELRNSTAHVFVDAIDVPVLDEIDAHHLLRVLRVKPSDAVTVSDGKGKWYSGVLNADASISATSEVFTTDAPRWQLTVAFSIVKGDRPELMKLLYWPRPFAVWFVGIMTAQAKILSASDESPVKQRCNRVALGCRTFTVLPKCQLSPTCLLPTRAVFALMHPIGQLQSVPKVVLRLKRLKIVMV